MGQSGQVLGREAQLIIHKISIVDADRADDSFGSFASFNNATRRVRYTRDRDRIAAPQHLTHWARFGHF